MKSTARKPFLAPIVEMRPAEPLDMYLFRRRIVVDRARADWLRAGPMGQAKDANGNPLYRINDRAQWTRTNPLPRSRRRAVLERDGHACVECRSKKLLEVDHIIRYIDGGSHDMENLRTLCQKCHARRGGKAES